MLCCVFWYGDCDSRRDVTALVVQHWVRDNVVTVPRGTVLNDVLGDPAPDRVKELHVAFLARRQGTSLLQRIDEYAPAHADVVFRLDPSQACPLQAFPLLFHKQLLGAPAPALTYACTHALPHTMPPRATWAHVHCFRLEHLALRFTATTRAALSAQHRVLLTYYSGDAAHVPRGWVALRLQHNQGMDIGGKFAAVDYLRRQRCAYTHLLLLHSKTDDAARHKYTEPLLHVDSRRLMPRTTYFPRELRRVPGTSNFDLHADWARDAAYVCELHGYLGMHATTAPQTFVEGNVGIVTRAVAELLYGDAELFRALNTPTSIDCNWARLFHKLPADWTHAQVHAHCRANALAPNNLALRYTTPEDGQLRDGMLEHAFERTTLAVARHLGEHVSWLE